MLSVPAHIILLAEQLCANSNMKHKMSAVVYNKNDVLGQGWNRWLRVGKSYACLYGRPVRSIHAEVAALRWAIRKHGHQKLYGASIYVHRQNGRYAKPCTHCWQTAELLGISEINWSG